MNLTSAAKLASCCILSAAGACVPFRLDADDRFSHSGVRRVGEIAQLDLAARSHTKPTTVEEELERGSGEAYEHAAPSAERMELSLADLRLHALNNNLDLAVVLQDPVIARTRVSEEEAKFDATISAGVRYKRSDLPELDNDLVSFTSHDKDLDKAVVKLTEIEQQKERLEVDYGVNIPLPSGGNVKILNRLDEQNKLEPQRFEQYVSSLKFSISQPLLRNAGLDYNLASIRLARLNADSVSAKTKLAAIRVLASAEKAYWRAYAGRRVAEVRAQQLDLAAQNLEMVRRRVSQGSSPAIEIVRADLGVTQRVEAFIVAQTSERIQQRELKRVLNIEGIDLNSVTAIDTTTEPRLVGYELSAEELVDAALANRMEILELELKLAGDAVKIDVARNQQLPYFALDFEYGILDRQGSFGTAWQDMWDFDKQELAVGVRGELPVTNDAREARFRRAVLNRQQRLSTREQRQLSVRQEVYDALDVLDQNWQRILAARRNVIAAGVNYEAEQKQFEEGLRTMREVLEALAQLGEAQLREVKAVVAYQIAQVDLAYATGTLLGYARVGWAPYKIDGTTSPNPN
ncbi:MAG: TolC family protein [Planctomycetota bacterium]|jgi:outer membrane protein TolC